MHELKHDGYRLQIHIRDGRVKLYTMNGADWSNRYPRIVEEAPRIKATAILDAKVVCLDAEGVANFDALHSRTVDREAVACAFDLLVRDGDDLRCRPLIERKADLAKLLFCSRGGIQYVEHAEGHGSPSKSWIKVKNPKAPAATRAMDGSFSGTPTWVKWLPP
jgi:ATP-dependent DNA ligase